MNDDPYFREPEDSASVWRYMNFSQFVSLIVKSQLFFSKIDNFSDKFEGTWANTIERSIEESPFAQAILKSGDSVDGLRQSFEVFRNHLYQRACLSCWHLNEYESAAMWSSYLKTNEGIAIRTTFKNLMASFGEFHDKERISAGIVDYADYDKDILMYHFYVPFLTKLKSYQHENELRLLYHARVAQGKEDEFKGGVFIDVDLNKLIEKIYISPNSPEWFKDLVRDFLKKVNLNFEIISSSLKDRSLK